MIPAHKVRIQVIYGQGGKGPFSAGFIRFADALREIGYVVDDTVLWKYPQVISELVEASKADLDCIFGFSLGGNAATWAQATDVKVDLIACYDPSVGIGPVRAQPPSVIGTNVRKTICYRGIGLRIAGGARVVGHNVTEIQTRLGHLAVAGDPGLHAITLRALENMRRGEGERNESANQS